MHQKKARGVISRGDLLKRTGMDNKAAKLLWHARHNFTLLSAAAGSVTKGERMRCSQRASGSSLSAVERGAHLHFFPPCTMERQTKSHAPHKNRIRVNFVSRSSGTFFSLICVQKMLILTADAFGQVLRADWNLHDRNGQIWKRPASVVAKYLAWFAGGRVLVHDCRQN